MRTPRLHASFVAILLIACGGTGSTAQTSSTPAHAEPPAAIAAPVPTAPTAQLPDGVTPTHYRVSLEVLPERESFRGEVEITVQLEGERTELWIHAAERMTDVTGTIGGQPIEWLHSDRDEVALVRWSDALVGEQTLHVGFTAPFDRQLRGLYRVDVREDHYAFTQFEATSARYAFPCFDEPRWKTPFDISLVVREADRAVANTLETGTEALSEGLVRHTFATTLPLPTYLVAVAVGPLDIVEAPPIAATSIRTRALPFRGVAARGRGPELAFALEHTPALLTALEDYFGTEYPYDKLDIIAVPDFASGAMENAGAITFREELLLLQSGAPEEQVRRFTGVMAHELAHQWFGNLVTMPWWDDIWLNEAFATWMGNKITHVVHPEMHADTRQLAGIHYAMGQDSLAAARQIRQPIESDHDIRNAFDSITYQKGGGVLSMFESYMGEDEFREGIRTYLRQHRFSTATADDLLSSLSEVLGNDVGTPFRTFLEQPGVPHLEAHLVCGEGAPRLELTQRRHLPLGSTASADSRWQIPVCARYPEGRQTRTSCTLLTETSGSLELETSRCPAWVMPNADGNGYYRTSLPSAELRALLDRGLSQLNARERLALASDLRAAASAGAVPAADVLAALTRLATDADRSVATDAMGFVRYVVEEFVAEEQRSVARSWASSLYAARARSLGWTARPRDDGETRLLRRDVLSFMAMVARDPAVRAEAARRGRAFVGYGEGGDGAIHRDAVESDLVGIALAVAVQEGDAAFFTALVTHLAASDDAVLRGELLGALGSIEDPELGALALELALDPRVRVNEVLHTVSAQVGRPEGRVRAWAWTQARFDALSERIATTRAGALPWYFSGFCDAEHRAELAAFFEPRIAELPGGPRNLRGALEAIDLCIAREAAQRQSVQAFFAARGGR